MEDNDIILQFIDAYRSQSNLTQYVSLIDSAKPFGLEYGPVYHSIRGSDYIGGFRNKRILEMGGALPCSYVFQTLKAEDWTAVEYKDNAQQYAGHDDARYKYYDKGWHDFYREWVTMSGKQYDACYSIAAFEHIYDLAGCLNAIHSMLKNAGILYSYFSPIWSAPEGSHSCAPSEISHLGAHRHLMFNYASLQMFLIDRCSVIPERANKLAETLYRSRHINRYTYEDYISIFESSRFRHKEIRPLGAVPFSELYSPDVVEIIRSCHGKLSTSCHGFEVILVK